MKRPGTCAQDRNPAPSKAAEGQRNGLRQPCPRRLRDCKVWIEAKLAC